MAQNKSYVLTFILLVGFAVTAFAEYSPNNNSLPISIKQQLLSGQYRQALPPLIKLAEQGNNKAQYQLALLYLHGKSVKKSAKKAEYWLLQAAKSNKNASYLIGSLYAQGKALTKNLDKARTFLALSKKSGSKKAKKLYQSLFIANNVEISSKQLQVDLIKAIKSGSLSKVTNLYQQGAILTPIDEPSNPLMIALKSQQKEISLWIIAQVQG